MAKLTLYKNYFSFFCDSCKKPAKQKKANYYAAKARNQKLFFCNQKCKHDYYTAQIQTNVNCAWCNKKLHRTQSYIKHSKSGNQFCNSSHAAFYNNKRRKKSTRSKIEIKFFNNLQNKFPNLTMFPNDKIMLNGYEVDVAIPQLQLAIEWNGMIHFKPMYGKEKLLKIQQRDKEKLKIASNNNVNLIIITDLVSNDKILNEAINQVSDIINSLI